MPPGPVPATPSTARLASSFPLLNHDFTLLDLFIGDAVGECLVRSRSIDPATILFVVLPVSYLVFQSRDVLRHFYIKRSFYTASPISSWRRYRSGSIVELRKGETAVRGLGGSLRTS